MPGCGTRIRRDLADESVVVVPSISLEHTTAGSGTLMQAMEERAPPALLLRQPRLRMIYVTSMPVQESIVEYYLGLLSGVIPSHARARLTMVRSATLAHLLERQAARPAEDAPRDPVAHPQPGAQPPDPVQHDPLERDVALSLGIPMYGADPRLAELGSKTGCRRMFEELGVPCLVGADDLHSVDDIVAGIQGMRTRRPTLTEAIVKLNEGVSGAGNAVVDLHGLPAPGSSTESEEIRARVLAMELEADDLTLDVYLAAFAAHGGIVEERITGTALTSPSVQMRALPDGQVELLSTHDQLLGGASGQRYLGCVFPRTSSTPRRSPNPPWWSDVTSRGSA